MKRGKMFTNGSLIVFSCLVLFGQLTLFPCTVAVVSGKATPDGRPLMWKTRDTSSLDNKIFYFTGKKFSFIGLIDAKDNQAMNVWAGINSAGFAIMNSASSDLTPGVMDMSHNGLFMKWALEVCASMAAFEKLLEETNGKRRVGANFGVIDATGNACFFETSNSSFQKFDANDLEIAPQGFIVRTNYAFTAPVKGGGGGYIRFDRAQKLFLEAAANSRLTHTFILQEAARDLVNEKLHSFPLKHPEAGDASNPLYINTNDTINRNSTASVALFHGVTDPDDAHLSTMWILLGQPVCSVAVPLWVEGASIPAVLTGPETAPLNDLTRCLASYLYPDQKGHMSQYLNVTRLVSYGGKGILKRLLEMENHVLSETGKRLKEWEKKKPDRQDYIDFQEKMANWVHDSLKNSFPDILVKEKK